MAAERMSNLEQRVSDVDNQVRVNDTRFLTINGNVASLGESFNQLRTISDKFHDMMSQLSADVTAYKNTMDSEKSHVLREINEELDQHKAALAQVVNDARSEFVEVKGKLSALYGGTGQGFVDLRAKVEEIAQDIKQRTFGGSGTDAKWNSAEERNIRRCHSRLNLKQLGP